MTENEIIDAIKLIMEHGCNGIDCTECPLFKAETDTPKRELCASIDAMWSQR